MNIAAHIRKEAFGNAAANGLINGGFAWLLSRSKEEVLVWGPSGLVADFFYTTLILVFLLSLIVLPIQRKKLLKMAIQSTLSSVEPGRFLVWISSYRNSIKSVILAIVAASIALPILWVCFAIAGEASYSALEFTSLKAAYTALLAASIVPILVKVTVLTTPPVTNVKV